MPAKLRFADREPSLESVMGLRRTRGLERDLSPVLTRCDDDAERRSLRPGDLRIAPS